MPGNGGLFGTIEWEGGGNHPGRGGPGGLMSGNGGLFGTIEWEGGGTHPGRSGPGGGGGSHPAFPGGPENGPEGKSGY